MKCCETCTYYCCGNYPECTSEDSCFGYEDYPFYEPKIEDDGGVTYEQGKT
jgi:hypothetical protein